ncbi:FG-GAP-like repeat-containing protein [Sulfitobacter mediterraneus]|uniref:FG-GAP-like repeat-containing protein n=1 Tax=Sulfitobacter mediterraneus TaxID=83219 RepID=UPI00248FE758|nr:FG-GAP-like repeat-containing protein [Sulfitobacter mediterraneus]
MPLSNAAGATLSIVAHIDDDLLFQNPDIQHSISAGGGHTTVYLTAGDAGQDADYWEGRELGAKAAYAHMAGANDWVDTVTTFSNGSDDFEVRASYLESDPDVRLYFLRLPDGNPNGSGYASTDQQSLEQLWDGDIATIDSVDGANSLSADDVSGLLLGIMEHHQPDAILIQDHSSEHAGGNHSDHVNSSQFAYEAQQFYSGDHELISYVEYASADLGGNLSDEDAAQNLDTFYEYAAHDPHVASGTDADGNPIISDTYRAWTEASYEVGNLPDPHAHPENWSDQFASGAGGWDNAEHIRTLADINGDGMADIAGFGETGVQIAHSDGTQFESATTAINDFTQNAGGWRVDTHDRALGDVDGDGLDDIVGFGGSNVIVALSDGSGFETIELWSNGFDSDAGWTSSRHERDVADVDGDGLADVVAFGENQVTVALSTGTGFEAGQRWSTDFGYNDGWRMDDHVRVLDDVNGDGLADIVGFGSDGVSVATSNSSGFDETELWLDEAAAGSDWNAADHTRTIADVDGDGLSDVVSFGADGVYVALSTGTGFDDATSWSTLMGASEGWTNDADARAVADVDGDGMADLVGFGAEGVQVALSTGTGFEQVDGAPLVQDFDTAAYVSDSNPPEDDTNQATEGDDNLVGTTGDDTILALGGDDSVEGDAGDDLIDGGDGADTLRGGLGADTINGGDGDDQIEGLYGDDVITAGAGNDHVFARDEDDIVYGNDGDDTLIGGRGTDTIYGGAGNDLIAGSQLDDEIHGGDGHDLVFIGTPEGSDRIFLDDGNDILDGGSAGSGFYAEGGNGNDLMNSGVGNDTLLGGAGNDQINSGAGDDQIYAGGGSDVVTGGDGDDVFFLQDLPGSVRITDFGANGAADQIDLSEIAGFDTAETLSDALSWVDGEMTVTLPVTDGVLTVTVLSDAPLSAGDFGLTGDLVLPEVVEDTVDDGSGDDTVDGGNGDDTGDGGSGDDTVDGGSGDGPFYSLEGPDAGHFDVNAATGEVSNKDWFTPDYNQVWDTNGDHIYETSVIEHDATGAEIGRSDLQLVVTPTEAIWRDAIDLTGGDDTVDDGTGDDTVDDGSGDDTVDDGTGDDTVDDGSGDDTVDDGTGDDTVDGGTGDDTVDGGTGDDTVSGGDGGDPLDGGTGAGESYVLSGADAGHFDLDPDTGEVTNKDWFTPNYDQVWDTNGDHIYEVSVLGLDENGAEISANHFELVVTPTDTFWQVGDAPLDDGGDTDPGEDPDTGDDIDPDDGTGGDTGGDTGGGPDETVLRFALEGPDAGHFDVDNDTGEVSNKSWFTPSYDQLWDTNGDHIYDVSVVEFDEVGEEIGRDALQLVVTETDSFWQDAPAPATDPAEMTGEEIMAALALPEGADDGMIPQDDPEEMEDPMLGF